MNIRKRSAALMILAAVLMLTACDTVPNDTAETSVSTSSEEIEANTSGIAFSHESGFYSSAFSLSITASDPEAKIYYTADGSVPDTSSALYTGPIKLKDKSKEPNILSAHENTSVGNYYIPRQKVTKANVIRAAVISDDGSILEECSGTYFIGIDREKEYSDVPVISLMTDFENLFDYEKGIYTTGMTYDDWLAEDENHINLEGWEASANFTNRGREWERPVDFEIINADGTTFGMDMGMRIMGAASRNAPQKSLRLIAREDYGEKALEYDIIPGNIRSDGSGPVTKYKSFVLRNGGNDCDYAKIRDPLFQQLTADRRYDTLRTAPCVVFINGEYWGMYTITEDYSDNYIENNYGIDNKNVVMVKRGEIEEGEESDIELYNSMFDFIAENDMTDPEMYAKACEMLDMGGYIDMCAMNFYIYNEDSFLKNNNWRMWRVKDTDEASPYADGKWRILIYDTDFSAGIYNGGSNFRDDNISSYLRSPGIQEAEYDDSGEKIRDQADLFSSLYANEDFRNELILTLCDMRNYDFNSADAIDAALEYYETYKLLVPDTFKRFGPDWIARQDTERYYEEQFNSLLIYIDGRYEAMPSVMIKAFGLESKVSAQISTSDISKGCIMVNNTLLDGKESVKGCYFIGQEIKIKAVPAEGKAFREWKYSGCTISDPTSPEAMISVTGDMTIEAVFE